MPLNPDNEGLRTHKEIARLWQGDKPTPEEFVKYLSDPPQLKVAAARYRMEANGERLSSSVITKIIDLRRKAAELDDVINALRPDIDEDDDAKEKMIVT